MRYFLTTFLLVIVLTVSFAQPIYTGKNLGKAKVVLKQNSYSLKNNAIQINWLINNKDQLQMSGIVNKTTKENVLLDPTCWFYIDLANNTHLNSNDFAVVSPPKVSDFIKKGIKGKQLSATLYNKKYALTIEWKAMLSDNANYIKQHVSIQTKDTIKITKIGLINIPSTNKFQSSGVVAGSPLTSKSIFCAIEHPLTENDTVGSISSFIRRFEPLSKNKTLEFSAVWGVSPENQLRRSFLYYLESERAVPYRQQLHYNSWYDISWVDRKMNEELCSDRISMFGDSLIVKRGINMNAFLFDDGWDNNKSLWQFNDGFPNGFSNMLKLAKKYNSSLGVWISPWGGYDEAKIQRLQYGEQQIPPFETNANGFSLSGKNYYNRFFDVAKSFVTKQGVTMFKFDGVGAGDGSEGANTSYEKDIDALLKLIPDLRDINPDLYFSLTVGTWPSPYWLFYGDAIWRNGWDTGMSGEGSKRQQWINFRDKEAYQNIVKRGSLYPLNAIMYHGICIADNGVPDSLEMNDKDIEDEIWSFFGTGTSLQELYVNPHKLNTNNWNCLAKAIKWAKSNEDIMVDTHWIGGSPGAGEIYGYASWSPEKAVLTLRNPSGKKQSILINVMEAFEIPANFKKSDYDFFDAKTSDLKNPVLSGKLIQIELQPFEVKVFNAIPAK